MEGHAIFAISYGDSLIRHPLQVYEMFLYFMAVVMMIRWKVKSRSSKYFLSILLFCVVQVFAEAIKNPTDTLVFANKFLGLKILQWIYLSLALFSLLFYHQSEKSSQSETIKSPRYDVRANLTLLIIVAISFYIIHPFLYRIEIYAINMALLPAIFLSPVQLFNYFTIPKYRWASLLILIVPLFLMNQTIPTENKTQQVYRTVGVGYNGGNFENHIVNDTDPGSCSGYSFNTDFKQKYKVISFGYSTTKIREKDAFCYGLNVSYGNIEETNLRTNQISSNTVVSFNPYFKSDLNWIGIGLGVHVGNNFYVLNKSVHRGAVYPDTGLGTSQVYPQAHFRIGSKRFFAAEYNFANHFPSAMPVFTHEISMGSGFGARNDFFIKASGVIGSQTHTDFGGYISGTIPIENKIIVEPLVGLGSLSNVYMLGISYRFGFHETTYE